MALCLVLWSICGTASAQNTWTAGVDTTWNTTTANWSSSPWTDGATTAVFGGTGVGPVAISGTRTVGGLTVNANGYVFSGGAINLNSGTTTFTIDNDARIDSVVGGGAKSLAKAGAGTLELTSTAAYTGNTLVNAGTLKLSGSNLLSQSGTINVAGSATLDLGGGSQTTGTTAPVFGNGATLRNGTLQYSPANQGTSFRFMTSGTMNLGAGGAFVSDGNFAAQSVNNWNLVINADPTASLTFGGYWDGFSENTIGWTASNQRVELNGGSLNFTNSPNPNLRGSGVLNIATGSGSGELVINSGTVRVGWKSTIGGNDSQSSPVGSGTLSITNGAYIVGVSTSSQGSADTGTLFMKDLSGTKTASGTSSINLNTGATLSLSRLVAGNNGASSGVNVVTFNGGTLQARAPGAGSFTTGTNFLVEANSLTVNVGNGGATIDSQEFDITVAEPLQNAGSGGLKKLGTGVLSLTGSNTYIGGTTIEQGALRFPSKLVIPASGGISVSGGAMLTVGASDSQSDYFTTADLNNLFANTLPNYTLAASSGVGIDTTPGNFTYIVTATAGRGLGKFGSNTLTLGAGSTVNTTGRLWVYSGTLALGGNSLTVGGLQSTSTTAVISTEAGGPATLTVDQAGDFSYSGRLSGTGANALSLVKRGSGRLSLLSSSTYSGGTTLESGTIRFFHADALGTSGTISVTGTATLVAGTTALNRPIQTSSAASLLFDTQGFTLASTIAGAGGLTKSGTGRLNLTATSFTGTISAQQGILYLQAGTPGGVGQTISASSGVFIAPPATTTLLDRIVSTTNAFVIGLRADSTVSSSAAVVMTNHPNASLAGAHSGSGQEATLSAVITPANDTYRFGGGNVRLNVQSVLSGNRSVVVRGSTPQLTRTSYSFQSDDTLLSGSNTFSGTTTVTDAMLSVSTLAAGGATSGLGSASSSPANLVINGGALRYTGSTASTDRGFTIGPNGARIDAFGSGALTMTGSVAYQVPNTATRLVFGGTSTLGNSFAGVIGDNGTGSTSVMKFETGRWVLSGSNTFSGQTRIFNGTLEVSSFNRIVGGSASSSLGAPVTAAAGRIDLLTRGLIDGVTIEGSSPTLRYVGTGETTDRELWMGEDVTSGAGQSYYFEQAGPSGALVFDKVSLQAGHVGSHYFNVSNAGSLEIRFLNSKVNTDIYKTGTGLMILTGTAASPDYRTLRVDDGTLRIMNGLALLSSKGVGVVNGTLDILSSSTVAGFTLSGTGSVAGTHALNNNNTVMTISNSSGTSRASAQLAGGGGLTKSGNGSSIVSGMNTFTGKTTISGGLLEINSIANSGTTNASALGAPTVANSQIDIGATTVSGTLRYVGTNPAGHSTDRTIRLTGSSGGATLDASGAGPLQLASVTTATAGTKTITLTGTSGAANAIGAIDGTDVSVTKTGGGLWRLTGANSFTGRLTVADGSVVVAVNAPSQSAGAFGASSSFRPIIGASGTSGTASLQLAANFTISRDVEVAAIGGGSQEVILRGVGSGTSTYDNNTSILLGRGVTLSATSGNTLVFENQWKNAANESNPQVAYQVGTAGDTGIVEFRSVVSASATGVSVRHGTLKLNAGTNTIAPTTPVSLGTVGGSGTLDLTGIQVLGSLGFSGSASFVNTTSGTGLLVMYASGTTATVNVADGIGHVISTPMELDGDTVFQVASGARVAVNSSIAEGLEGPKWIRKDGVGTLVFSAGNSYGYGGGTEVSAGTFINNGSLGSGTVTVASGATLMGSGTFGGLTVVQGIHSPGNSPGLPTYAGGLTYSGSTSQVIWELWANTDAAEDRGVVYDGIDVTGGALTIGADAALVLDFGSSPTSTVDWDDEFWAESRSWKFIDVNGGSWNGALFQSISWGNDAFGDSLLSKRPDAMFTVSQNGGDLYVDYVIVVPEPHALALAAIGIAIAARARRRR